MKNKNNQLALWGDFAFDTGGDGRFAISQHQQKVGKKFVAKGDRTKDKDGFLLEGGSRVDRALRMTVLPVQSEQGESLADNHPDMSRPELQALRVKLQHELMVKGSALFQSMVASGKYTGVSLSVDKKTGRTTMVIQPAKFIVLEPTKDELIAMAKKLGLTVTEAEAPAKA